MVVSGGFIRQQLRVHGAHRIRHESVRGKNCPSLAPSVYILGAGQHHNERYETCCERVERHFGARRGLEEVYGVQDTRSNALKWQDPHEAERSLDDTSCLHATILTFSIGMLEMDQVQNIISAPVSARAYDTFGLAVSRRKPCQLGAAYPSEFHCPRRVFGVHEVFEAFTGRGEAKTRVDTRISQMDEAL